MNIASASQSSDPSKSRATKSFGTRSWCKLVFVDGCITHVPLSMPFFVIPLNQGSTLRRDLRPFWGRVFLTRYSRYLVIKLYGLSMCSWNALFLWFIFLTRTWISDNRRYAHIDITNDSTINIVNEDKTMVLGNVQMDNKYGFQAIELLQRFCLSLKCDQQLGSLNFACCLKPAPSTLCHFFTFSFALSMTFECHHVRLWMSISSWFAKQSGRVHFHESGLLRRS